MEVGDSGCKRKSGDECWKTNVPRTELEPHYEAIGVHVTDCTSRDLMSDSSGFWIVEDTPLVRFCFTSLFLMEMGL